MLLQPYTPEWVLQFKALEQELQQSLVGVAHSIEHVGSTAVPGLAAKPIIDIDIIYTGEGLLSQLKSRLEQSGYYHNGNQGIPDREVFKRAPGGSHPVFDGIPHHLYVCLAGSPALERHILLRDFLRKNEWARRTYQQMKLDIAAEVNQNRKQYAALKEERVNPFIDEVIALERQSSAPGQ